MNVVIQILTFVGISASLPAAVLVGEALAELVARAIRKPNAESEALT